MKDIRIFSLALAALSALCLDASAQNSIGDILRSVETNNPRLKAAAAQVEVDKRDNRSTALLDSPEFEFNYLWGADGIGNRHDVRVTQGFDIATLTGMKSSQVKGLDSLSTLRFKAERLEVLLEARQTCIDLVYCNALKAELDTHLSQAEKLVTSYEKKFKAGDTNVLDLNKAKIHLTAVRGQVSEIEVERQSLLAKLKSLNGGQEIVLEDVAYDASEVLPADFKTWYETAAAKNPALAYARQEIQVNRKQLSIDKTAWLPELTVGYMSEIATADKFRGVTVGVAIPLWSNANRVKKAKAQTVAAASRAEAAESRFFLELEAQYNKAASLKENSELMRAALSETDSRDFLLAAQAKGEISMIEYLVETDQYYEALERTLEAERAYHQALALLNAVEL